MENKIKISEMLTPYKKHLIKFYLKFARELIDDKDSWTQSGGVFDGYGNSCHPSSDVARCWGSLDAVRAGMGKDSLPHCGMDTYILAAAILNRHSPDISFLEYNDRPDTKHSDIIAVFDNAIESLDVSEGEWNNG